jgi:hypothetical protein
MSFVEGKRCLATSATEKQLLGQLWTEVRHRFAASNLPGVLLASCLDIGGVKMIFTMTSGSVSNLTGWHWAAGVFIAISEGQGEQVEAASYDAAIASLVDDRSAIVVAGNPSKSTGRFYEIHSNPMWQQIHFSAYDHPNVQQGREVILGGPSVQWIEEVKQEYGQDSPYFVSRVCGQFPTEGSVDALVSRALIAFELHRTLHWHQRSSGLGRRIYADIARQGPDSTCVAVRWGQNVIEELTTWHEPDLMKTAKRLHERALELGFYRVGRAHPTQEDVFNARVSITTDDVGVGSGVTDRLRELGARVEAFNGAQRPLRHPDRFANRRAEAYFELRDKLIRGTLSLPRDELLAEELLNTSFTTNNSGLILIEKKDDIRRRIRRSPDRADTCSLACEPFHTSWSGHFYA